jgi:hypothetical protein
VTEHCACCVHSLGFGPRLQRILAHLVQHPSWEHDPNLEAIRFRILDRGSDASRVTFQTTTREQLGEVRLAAVLTLRVDS